MDRRTFLANLQESGLITEDQLARVEDQLPATDRGRALARALVDLGLLTRFQAERLLIGRTSGFLLGQYCILDQLGRGGMGRVFKAKHRTMNRLVALKVLAPNLVQTQRAQDLFLREVRAVAQIVHPNVVTAFDANNIGGRYFLVLEYVDGPNLDQLVRKGGPLPVGLACDYVRQIANGLQCAHQLGMVHRDIKPSNILVQRRGLQADAPGLVKISDFGLARLNAPNADPSISAGTILLKANTVMGTPDYLSPEQTRSMHDTDIRSDLYSLGCTFYFLLAGRVPFPGGTAMEKLVRQSTEVPPRLTEFRSDIPPEVVAVVEILMAKNPDNRFQTPEDLAAAIQPFAVGGPTPWAPSHAGTEAAEEEEESVGSDASDELSALVNTLPTGMSPTPLTNTDSRRRSHVTADAQRRLHLAILIAIGIVGGLLTFCTILSLVFGNK
jgi:serine/threonine-protein kinase